MKNRKYYHTFSEALRFTETEQEYIDKMIINFNEYCFNFIGKIYSPTNNFDFSLETQDYPLDYFKYGYDLIQHCLCPELLDVLMDNRLSILIKHSDTNLFFLQFCLLFVKKSIVLMHQGLWKEFFILCEQVSSNNIKLEKYKSHFLR